MSRVLTIAVTTAFCLPTAAAVAQGSSNNPLVARRICVVDSAGTRVVQAQYNTATGDTTVDGRPFSTVYPSGGAFYAANAPWYVLSEVIPFGGARYRKYGLPRVIGSSEVVRIGANGPVGVFAEPGAGAAPDVIYVPVRVVCEFQPYRREP